MSETHHTTDTELGGTRDPRRTPRRSPALYVIPEGWQPTRDTPPPREQCKTGPRPCPHVLCPSHLWFVDGRDRPGRRHPGKGPPPSIVRAHSERSCADDIADAVARGEKVTGADIARALGISDRRLRDILREAKRKLREDPAALELLGGDRA